MPSGDRLSRRALLGSIAGGVGAALAGCSLPDSEPDATTTAVDEDRARALAERFAPTIYFDRNERWFPTDPSRYESERDGQTVVDGFDAFEGYVRDGGSTDPPAPTAFYHVVEYAGSPLAVVQYWLYSAFDQFSANFHWHDWELLQVFVDTETDELQLYVASSHSRKVPNNEYLDPDGRPRVLSELGSHSSGLSVNDDPDAFQRLPLGGDAADITNSIVEEIEDVASIPMAYGLPRDEGLQLPFVVPELDGTPLYDHERLPSVESADLVPEGLTVRSFDALSSPPADLPTRETGFRFEHRGRDADADVSYELAPTADLEHIAAFTGPQLSFEFSVPDFAEDLVSGHITTSGTPWKQPRYDAPASDITDPAHRETLANRYDAIGAPPARNQVVASVTNAVSADDAPEDEGLITVDSPTELFALLQSDPEAVPTFQGLAVVQDVSEGEHTLTVNGAGVTPHSETVAVPDEGTSVAGVDGEIPVVAQENALKLEVDPRNAEADLTALAVEDDFAGRLYDAPLDGPDAVYVHRGGAFTTEVRDAADELGAFRVNPDTTGPVRLDRPETGKASLATYLADVGEETQAQVDAVAGETAAGGKGNAVSGLATALAAVAEAARAAAENANAGDRRAADRRLDAVASRLGTVSDRLAAARGDLPDGLANAVDNRLGQAQRRSEQAKTAEKL
ncbi:hypothetical protein BRC72_02650 [Halobacteriales archaeon QH_7_66_36]|nr:MAG: hypothetical protein BRC72_02650 [Halobacteriales archaeon QH_7_66_36]